MQHFFMDVTFLLRYFGTEVRIWDIKLKPEKEYFLGAPLEGAKWIDNVEPEIRYEPVVPYSSTYQKYAFAAFALAGGTEDEYNLSFYSQGNFTIGSIVEVPSMGKDKYRIASKADYGNYSNSYVYQLRGDSQHKDGQ